MSARTLRLIAGTIGIFAFLAAALWLAIVLTPFFQAEFFLPDGSDRVDRFSFVLFFFFVIWRFVPVVRKRSASHVVGDVVLPFIAVMSALWFIHTGSIRPFGHSPSVLLDIAVIEAVATGIIYSRIAARRVDAPKKAAQVVRLQ